MLVTDYPDSSDDETNIRATDLHHPVTLGVIASLLNSGSVIDDASSVLFLASLFFFDRHWTSGVWLVAAGTLFAVAEKYHAWRVRLDAGLFDVLSRGSTEIQVFDAALAALFGNAVCPGRSMAERWSGTRKLFRRQLVFLMLQAVIMVLLFGASCWR
jgi:hypothetical protein